MYILYLYVQIITRQCFCFPNSQWGVTTHDTSLKTGRPVYVQLVPKTRNWIPGHIIERLSLRTYKVKTYNGGIYIRNRKFIKP